MLKIKRSRVPSGRVQTNKQTNYDSIQEVMLTIRKIESHCGKHRKGKDKAGEISIYTNIKKSPATTAAIKLFCDIS
jgi:hypothetical protein